MEDTLPTELVVEDGSQTVQTSEKLAGAKFVGIYFGAHWAPCCRRFTKTLQDYYGQINASERQFEVVFVSKDGNQEAFARNFSQMPWAAISYGDEARRRALEQQFGIMEIPSLVILSDTGALITQEGLRDLS